MFTISSWVKIVRHRVWSRLVDFSNGMSSDNIGFGLSYNQSGKPVFWMFNGMAHIEANSDSSLTLNEWTLLTMVYDVQTASIYINCTRTAFRTVPFSSRLKSLVRNTCLVGNTPWAELDDSDIPHAYFDELAFYNVPLSQSEICLVHRAKNPIPQTNAPTTTKKSCTDSLPRITCENLIRSYKNFCENSAKMNMECMRSCNRTDC